jgi:hypothetical protein
LPQGIITKLFSARGWRDEPEPHTRSDLETNKNLWLQIAKQIEMDDEIISDQIPSE